MGAIISWGRGYDGKEPKLSHVIVPPLGVNKPSICLTFLNAMEDRIVSLETGMPSFMSSSLPSIAFSNRILFKQKAVFTPEQTT